MAKKGIMKSEYVTFLSDEPVPYGSRIIIVSENEKENGKRVSFVITPSHTRQQISMTGDLKGQDNFIIARCTQKDEGSYLHRAVPTYILEEDNERIERELLNQ